MTITYRVYGRDGHRQRMSFGGSTSFTTERGNKVVIRNADITGTNRYSEVVITAESAGGCWCEILNQMYYGYFEESRIGDVVDMTNRDLINCGYPVNHDPELDFLQPKEEEATKAVGKKRYSVESGCGFVREDAEKYDCCEFDDETIRLCLEGNEWTLQGEYDSLEEATAKLNRCCSSITRTLCGTLYTYEVCAHRMCEDIYTDDDEIPESSEIIAIKYPDPKEFNRHIYIERQLRAPEIKGYVHVDYYGYGDFGYPNASGYVPQGRLKSPERLSDWYYNARTEELRRGYKEIYSKGKFVGVVRESAIYTEAYEDAGGYYSINPDGSISREFGTIRHLRDSGGNDVYLVRAY